jgi:hypothetical protein
MMRRHSSLSVFALLSLLGLALPASLWAQTERGSITGLVKDSSGAVIVGATITVTNLGTNATFAAKSQADGGYLVPDLLPAFYNISGEASGFKRLTVTGLKLDAGSTLTQDLSLEVGAVSQSISVTGTTSLVNTSSGSMTADINLSNILELPMRDRLVLGVLNLVPGVYFVGGSENPDNNYSVQIGPPGTRGQNEAFAQSDGMDNGISGEIGMTRSDPPPDDVQELQVNAFNESAEYGTTASFQVNMVTKSGTNAFHGDAYDVMRNGALDANLWNNLAHPPLHRNQLGGTIGGPILKNKLFFFAGFERVWNRIGSTDTANLGLLNFRTGDFSNAIGAVKGAAQVIPIYDPTTGLQFQCNGVLNVICPARIDPVAANVVKYMPLPNHAPTNSLNNGGNWLSDPIQPYDEPWVTGRVDYNLSSKTKLFVRNFLYIQNYYGYGGSGAADPAWGPAAAIQAKFQRNQNYVMNVTHLFSPTFFLDFTVGFGRVRAASGNTVPSGIDFPTKLGLQNFPAHNNTFGSFNISGGGANLVPVDGLGNTSDTLGIAGEWSFAPNFTKIIHSHTMKFGVLHNRYDDEIYGQPYGQFTFSGIYTSQWTPGGLQVANTGINMADFLLGLYSGNRASIHEPIDERTELYAAYFQDNWRATPNLTLNLGLRWEVEAPLWEEHNRLQNFDPGQPNPLAGQVINQGGVNYTMPANLMGVTTFAGLNGLGKYVWNFQKGNFMPRIGFAYRLFGRSDFVVRGGFGLFFNNAAPYGLGTQSGFNAAFTGAYSHSAPDTVPMYQGFPLSAAVFPTPAQLNTTFTDLGTTFYSSGGLTYISPQRYTPDVEQWNLDIQRQWKNTLFEVAYMGNSGHHLNSQNINFNTIPQALLPQTNGIGSNLYKLRPYPQWGSNGSLNAYQYSNANSSFNILTLKTERRFTNGLGYTVTWLWSKYIDNQNEGANDTATTLVAPSIQNYNNLNAEKALSGNDIPFRLVFAPIYDLPVGKGRHWLNQGGIVNAVLGGWEVSWMGTYQSGQPVDMTVSGGGSTYLGDPEQNLRPNLVSGCPLKASNAWTPLSNTYGVNYLNPACYTVPPNYTYGNEGRSEHVRGPGTYQDNMMLSKNWYYKEKYRAQLRCEAIDLFNTPQLGLPGQGFSPTGTNIGAITSSDGFTRRVFEFALKIYF